MAMRSFPLMLACASAVAFPATGYAALAPAMRGVLDAAIASGNDGDIDTVAKYLKKANPDDVAEIDHVIADHRKQIAAAKQEKLAHQTPLQGWKGEGQIGASQSSGNTSTVGFSAGINLAQEGLHWKHQLHALADFERTSGVTDRNQMQLGLETDYKFNPRLFAFGSALAEDDRFAGFNSRFSVAGGVGYNLVTEPNLTIDAKAGPAWRRTNFIGEPSESEITGLAAIDASWKVLPAVTLSENAALLSGHNNTNITSLTALSLKISRALSARVSYQLGYNSEPPVHFKKTDTLTRFTLVYGF
jgi:putative salt-induced outer membrane protein